MKTRLLHLLVSLFLPVVLGAAPTLEQLATDPQLWPKEVAVTGPVKATVLRDGRPAGIMLIVTGKDEAPGVRSRLHERRSQHPRDGRLHER